MTRRCLVVLALLASAADAQQIQLPPVTRARWDHGARVILMEYHRAPTLRVLATFPGGGCGDPPGKAGVAKLVADLLTKGTTGRNATQLAEAIDFLGGSLGASAGDDRLTISLSVLSKDTDAGLDLMADVLRRSTFPMEELERERQLTLASLQSLSENPAAVRDRVASEIVFGPHPYGAEPTVASMRSIARDDIVNFAGRFIAPDELILVAVGDFKTGEMLDKLRARFGDWPRAPMARLSVSPPSPQPRKVVLIDKPDATQTQVRWARLGLARNSPDYMAADLADTMLGGGFTSRLVDEIRVNRSLTYGISSNFRAQLRGGDFGVATFTKIETTRELLQATEAVLKRTANKGFTADELLKFKGFLTGQFAISLQTPDALAARLNDMAFFGLPDDYLQTYLSKLRAVTLADANRIARAYFAPEHLSLALVGPAAKIKDQLQGIGAYETKPVDAVGK